MSRSDPAFVLRTWCLKLFEPACMLSILSMIGFACTWAESRSINRVQIEDRIVVLERRSEEHSTALLHVQEFSAQIAAMNARLDGIYQLVNVMKDDTSHQLDTLNRRMDAMQQQIGDHH